MLKQQPYIIKTIAEPPRSSPQHDAATGTNGPATDVSGNAITYTDEYGNLAENSTIRELPTVCAAYIDLNWKF